MIDVSRFVVGDRCPRCRNRRVYAIEIERDQWMCVPSAMPFALREHAIEHNADELDGASQGERESYVKHMMGVLDGNAGR